MRRLALHWQILIAIVLAGIVGSIVKQYTTEAVTPSLLGVSFVSMFEYVGAIFLNALKMIIVPLITSSIIVGVAGIGSGGNIGQLGWRTLLFYASTTLAANVCRFNLPLLLNRDFPDVFFRPHERPVDTMVP